MWITIIKSIDISDKMIHHIRIPCEGDFIMSRKLKDGPYSQGIPLNILTVLVVSGLLFVFPALAKKSYQAAEADISEHYPEVQEDHLEGDLLTFHENTLSPFHTFSVREKSVVNNAEKSYEVVRIVRTTVTAYSSTVDQTNSQPFITASGAWVGDGIVAANFLPFGTQIRIPAFFGDKIFVVKDRMNSRYTNRVDIWFSSRQQAINFGLKNTDIEIVSEI